MKRQGEHKPAVLWLTGLPASGKSTLAMEVHRELLERKVASSILDGDQLRLGINRDLGFSPADRKENVRRIAEVARLMTDAGLIVIVAVVSPYRADRDLARSLFQSNEFIEVHVKCPLKVCVQRDPKSLYQKAKEGVISHFTGISAPYEAPFRPELMIETDRVTIQQGAKQIVAYLENHSFINRKV